MDVGDWIEDEDGDVGLIISNISGDREFKVKFLCSSTEYTKHINDLEPIKSPNFNVGDSVKVKGYDNIDEVIGLAYTSFMEVWEYELMKSYDNCSWQEADDLVLVNTVPPTKFQVGDDVLIANRISDQWNMVGPVRRIGGTNDIVVYTIRINGRDHSFEEQELSEVRYDNKTKSKETKMNKAKDQLESNKTAAVLAAKLVAGKAINKKLVKLIKPKLPMMLRGYAESPFASLVAANAVGVALKHYAPTNPKAMQIADLMLNAAALELLESFNIEEMLDGLLKGVKLPKIEEDDDK